MAILVSAKWGCGDTWALVTDRVREILNSGTDARVNVYDLKRNKADPPNDPAQGCDKELRMWFSDIGPIILRKDSVLSAAVVNSMATKPNHPYLICEDGAIVPLTEEHPPLLHFLWIKTNSAILREALEKIGQIVERHRLPVPPAGSDPVWIYECQQLDRYHDIRRALLQEAGRHLPDIEIPVLRDFTKSWQWGNAMPDERRFAEELLKVEHRANFQYVALLPSPENNSSMSQESARQETNPRNHENQQDVVQKRGWIGLPFLNLSAFGELAVILSCLSGHWNDPWLKYGLNTLFTITCTKISYKKSKEFWPRSKWLSGVVALVVLIAVGGVIVLSYCYSGGSMPSPKTIKIAKIVVAMIISGIAIYAWFWALHPPTPPTVAAPSAPNPVPISPPEKPQTTANPVPAAAASVLSPTPPTTHSATTSPTTQPKIARKQFRVIRPQVTVNAGGDSMWFFLDTAGDAVATPFVARGYRPPVVCRVKNSVVYFDGAISDGVHRTEIREGNPYALPIGWDMNQDDRAMEIVNKDYRVVFQVRYTSDLDATVIGLFNPSAEEYFILNNTETIGPTSRQNIIQASLPRIFLYPSWDHPGERIPRTNNAIISRPAITKDNPGRTFEVLGNHLLIGQTWHTGDRFTEYALRHTFPAPTPNPGDDPVKSTNDYYEEHIDRWLNSDPPSVRIVEPTVEKSKILQRDINATQLAILKDKLSAFSGQKFNVARVGFEDEPETANFAKKITLALMDCGWAGWMFEENYAINLGETRIYSGVSLFMFGHHNGKAFLRLKSALESIGIKMAPMFCRPPQLIASANVLEIIVGPDPDVVRS